MVEKWTRGWIFHSVNRNANPNNKYMKDGDKNKESSYLNYWDVNNSDGWAMSQKSPLNGFEWVEDISLFYKGFIQSYNEESEEWYFFQVYVKYLKKLYGLHSGLLFLPERIRIERVQKPFANLHDKNQWVIHIRNSKQALNHGLVLKKLYRVIKFNQKSWLKHEHRLT